MSSLSDTKRRLWDRLFLSGIRLGIWRKYLEEYGITEDQYLSKLQALRLRLDCKDPEHEAIWRLIYEINLTAHRTNDNRLMERTYRTMAIMTYDAGEDPKDMVELSMQYQLIQLDDASAFRTKYSRVEVVSGCPDCFSGRQVFEISIARALIPVPCKQCMNLTDNDHPYGLCECAWQAVVDNSCPDPQ